MDNKNIICRICLKFKKDLCSVFEMTDYGTYADIITTVAKVTILKGVYSSICSPCRIKLLSLYNFKKEIERSDMELNQQIKILRFDSIDEVKAQILSADEDKTISFDRDVRYLNVMENNCNIHGNTTITKIISCESNVGDNKPISEPKTIKYESDNDYVDLYDGMNTFDYTFSRSKHLRKKRRNEEKGSIQTLKCLSKFKTVCIKPIVLDNIKVISARTKTKQKEHNGTQHKKRLDICPYCGVMFSNIKTHILVHKGEKKFKCTQCSKAFFTSRQLSFHQRCHLMAGAFKCDHCVAVFNSKTSLQSHMISHTDEKSHICPTCNKGFKRKGALLRHKLIHNSSAKSLKCQLCNMSFLYKQGLQHHMRVHTGERPFKCEICSQPYSYKHDFNRHCLKKHGVFLKQRSVHVMNEQVLMREQELMKDLMLKIQGVIKEGETLNPFEGPNAALAFYQAVKALGSRQVPNDVI